MRRAILRPALTALGGLISAETSISLISAATAPGRLADQVSLLLEHHVPDDLLESSSGRHRHAAPPFSSSREKPALERWSDLHRPV
jgi:hypothetical protein